jgi:hypothetical protein
MRQSDFDSPVGAGLDQPGPRATAPITLPLGRTGERSVEDFGDARIRALDRAPSIRKLLPADTLTLNRAGSRWPR